MKALIFALAGYISGSVLYARVFAKLFRKNIVEMSRDNNPGTSNAFRYGGFWCGMLTLIFDLLKGFIPVFLYMTYIRPDLHNELSFSLVMASPVIGHAFPVFYHFKGGKGIAVTFGCLMGLFPFWQPLTVLAVFFILFSAALRITPHYHRTMIAYICSLLCMPVIVKIMSIWVGFVIVSFIVILRLLISKEDKGRIEVKLIWTH